MKEKLKFIDTSEFDEFLKTLKIHNKDINACFNDALVAEHLRQLFIKSNLKALDEYADWKIRECVGENEPEIIKEVFEGKPVMMRDTAAILRNQLRKQILSNKDKK